MKKNLLVWTDIIIWLLGSIVLLIACTPLGYTSFAQAHNIFPMPILGACYLHFIIENNTKYFPVIFTAWAVMIDKNQIYLGVAGLLILLIAKVVFEKLIAKASELN
jgi:hypothetical protein